MTTKNNSKNVMIHILSTYSGLKNDGESENDGNFGGPESISEVSDGTFSDQLDLTTEGVIRLNGSRIELEYFETELTGMEGSCTSISFERKNSGIISMIRTGTVTTALVFEEGKRHICTYNTEFAAFEVCVKTNKVVNNMTENGGNITLDYSIELHGAATAENTFIMINADLTGN